MTREETTKVLSIIKLAYPNFYKNITKQEAENTVNLYQEMFKEDEANLVMVAVKELINTFQYPPTIADIKNKMYKLTNIEKTPTELWNKLQSAISNSLYHSVEMFDGLPDEVKKFVGGPKQLKELSMMDSDVIHSVTKGQFFKQIETIQKRVKEDKLTLPETKNFQLDIGLIGKDINKLLN